MPQTQSTLARCSFTSVWRCSNRRCSLGIATGQGRAPNFLTLGIGLRYAFGCNLFIGEQI